MTRFLLSMVLGASAALGLLLPLPQGDAAVVAQTLMQTPVVLAPEAAPKAERRLQRALCAVARLQEYPVRLAQAGRLAEAWAGEGRVGEEDVGLCRPTSSLGDPSQPAMPPQPHASPSQHERALAWASSALLPARRMPVAGLREVGLWARSSGRAGGVRRACMQAQGSDAWWLHARPRNLQVTRKGTHTWIPYVVSHVSSQ
jgi:hypothetical protein